MFIPSLLVIIGFMIVHIFTNAIKRLEKRMTNRLVSLVSGGSIAYVLLHLVPELTHYQDVAHEAALVPWLEKVDYVTYMSALLGVAVFYGINQLSEKSERENRRKENLTRPSVSIFALEISAFALYNGLIGYLLQELSGDNIAAYVVYFIVFSFHFIANNRILHLTHEDLYTRIGRWVLAFSVLTGWILYEVTHASDLTLAFMSSFLTGGVVLNILNDELPEERESSFPAFIVGMIFIAVLLQVIIV
ncbi:hypothetical protein HF394_10615 [Planococcus glaciei]|uniref:ZIP Zinc transporter n=1 Tax=Planococcus glaciei TaxID=459472 RepID=A0A7H8QBR4_9BACL|nr:hypothetical protein [Planococcus glaciei]QDY45767.1 hypothetical protein FK545_11075 [Planococcus glaciei]QKX51002.1 hypothetical protein HF394_10615 [Planococcus glaciei]